MQLLMHIEMLKAFNLMLKTYDNKKKKTFNYSQTRIVQIYFVGAYNDYVYAKMLINGFVTYVALKLEQIS